MRDILIDDLSGIRVITIRRPDALNALHDGLNDEILAAIREVAVYCKSKGLNLRCETGQETPGLEPIRPQQQEDARARARIPGQRFSG